jgi:CHAT domain
MRSVELAPSFAEQFFRRGVTNFVCTAWPVDDVAAREFALTFYGNLLGLSRVDAQGTHYDATDPRPMHVAMREARLAVAGAIGGARTLGAYQHYGSPYFRFFDPVTMYRSQTASGNA